MNKAFFVFPFILLSLLLAIWAGWIRAGWSLPLTGPAGQHGALMVGSFLASLVFLERAVTFKNKWILLLPLLNALSLVAFIAAQPKIGYALLIAGGVGFMAMCTYFIYRYKELYYYLFLAGAFCYAAGNIILFKTLLYPAAVLWWMGFFLFTIVAERIELSRFLALTPLQRNLIIAALAAVLVSLFLPFSATANYFFAGAITLTALWLLKYDMAFRSLHIKGQHRYSAVLLITGYVWLIITAVLITFAPHFTFAYDAVLHSFFIGFVFSMIFSHAPIILPAVAKLPVKLYRPALYGWFVALQLSLLARVCGDVCENAWLRKEAAMVNGIVILLFFVQVGFIVKGELKKRQKLLRKA